MIEPDVYEDARGYFLETWSRERYRAIGIDLDFAQDNVSSSSSGVLRGLHLQCPTAQAKLVSVLAGEVFDVAVDVRVGSPRFGRWVGVTLSAARRNQLFIPPGFAHGFCVTGEHALFSYKCSQLYRPADELGIVWNDPDVGIAWPVREPRLSPKDAAYPRLADIPRDRLPRWEGP